MNSEALTPVQGTYYKPPVLAPDGFRCLARVRLAPLNGWREIVRYNKPDDGTLTQPFWFWAYDGCAVPFTEDELEFKELPGNEAHWLPLSAFEYGKEERRVEFCAVLGLFLAELPHGIDARVTFEDDRHAYVQLSDTSTDKCFRAGHRFTLSEEANRVARLFLQLSLKQLADLVAMHKRIGTEGGDP